MNIVRIVYEKGLELRRSEETLLWFFQSVRACQVAIEPNQVFQQYGLRPVLWGERLESGQERTFLLGWKGNEDALDFQLSDLSQAVTTKAFPIFFHSFNLQYVLGSVVYHCKRLAEAYSGITGDFSRAPFPGDYKNDLVFYAFQAEPYFELEALLSAARRCYNIAGRIIWHGLEGKGPDAPGNFEDTLKKSRNLPAAVRARLESSWSSFGSKLKDYRDCLHHFAPLHDGLPQTKMVRRAKGVWSCSAVIPDNPECNSQAGFRYENQVDALTCGWELTCELIAVANVIIAAIPDRDSTIDQGTHESPTI